MTVERKVLRDKSAPFRLNNWHLKSLEQDTKCIRSRHFQNELDFLFLKSNYSSGEI